MKRLNPLPVIFSIVFLLAVQVPFTACKKEIIREYYKTDTVKLTVIQKDTIVIKDTALSMQILIANQWKLQETKGVLNSSRVFYVRGGSGNTETFDNELIVFRADGTGSYWDPNFNTYQFTWNFTNAEKTSLSYTINFLIPNPTPTMITWDNIVYKDGKLKYAQYWTRGTTHAHSYDIRMPK